MKTIKGSIDYTITIDEGKVDIKHNTTLENDMACLLAAHYIMEGCAIMQRELKKDATGKEKQIISENLDYILKGRNGISVVLGQFMAGYEEFKRDEFMKANNITVETGTMTAEEVAELQKSSPTLKVVSGDNNKA